MTPYALRWSALKITVVNNCGFSRLTKRMFGWDRMLFIFSSLANQLRETSKLLQDSQKKDPWKENKV